eukprot:Em0013g1004a
MRAFGAEWRTANIEGKVLSKPTKSKRRVGWMIGDQNLEFDHGRAFWKPAAREVLTSTGSAVTPAGSAVPLPDEEDQHEEEEPDDNAHQQDIEEDKTHGEEYDSNDPLQLKLGDEIIKWTVLDDGVTVDQRSKDGFTWKQCAINWPSGLEVAEFRTALDCWNIMFPIQFFFGGDGVLRWTNESLPHNIQPFTEYEFLQCMGILLDVLPLSQYIVEDKEVICLNTRECMVVQQDVEYVQSLHQLQIMFV